MIVLRNLIFLVFLFAYGLSLKAQSDIKSTIISLEKDTIQLDSSTISPQSVQITINGKNVDKNKVYIDYVNARIVVPDSLKKGNVKITVSHQAFPIDFTKPYYHKSTDLIQKKSLAITNPFAYIPNNNVDAPWEINGLQKQGSLSRGVLVGNNQNLSVNSSLNLQLSGKLTEDVSILASISDQNIPIQPGGNTQKLQEFDQVYIQVYDDKSKLTAGDFTLGSPKSYFMKYFKRAQGGSFEAKVTTSDKSRLKVQASAAISKGKFARNSIQGIEGNQGPYRLVGADNEPFITILSGTERVYIDGVLLMRGQEHDYVIDYNTAELTFTAKKLITKDKRIVVEFQYSILNYQRSLFQVANSWQSEKWKLDFNIYAEQDNKNQPIQTDLDGDDKAVLASIGDDISKAIVSSVDTANFNTKQVLYALKDTSVNGVFVDSIYMFSQSQEAQLYRMTFSEVGFGRGNYIQSETIANGRVFQWIAPNQSTGLPQGNYEPIILIETPKQQQMYTFSGDFKSGGNQLSFETAVTNYDKNTFSSFDATDNIGSAAKVDWLNESKKSKSLLKVGAGLEFWNRNFKEIERVRSVEFYRDWNLLSSNLTEDQISVYGVLGIENKALKITHKTSLLNSGTSFNGWYHQFKSNVNMKKWSIDYNGRLLNSESVANETNFYRHKGVVKYDLGKVVLGYKDDFENNLKADISTDSLQKVAYRFYEYEYFIQNPDSSKNKYRLFYNQRNDYVPISNNLTLATVGQSYGGSFEWYQSNNFNLKSTTALRRLYIRDQSLTTNKADNSLLNRIEYQLKLFKGMIRTQSFYEVGSGLESKKEYTFLEVAAGQGTYTWKDYNGNGIKEIDEFEIALFQDQANFIKVFFPTNEYVQTFSNQFNQNLFLSPSLLWKNPDGFKKIVSRFSDQVAYRIDRKTTQNDLNKNLNPFLGEFQIADSNLISINNSLRNSLFFNRTAKVFGAEFTYQNVEGKTLLTNGFESRTNESYTTKLRLNVNSNFSLTNQYIVGNKINLSDFFNRRDYQIDYFTVEPKLTYQLGTSFRIATFFKYQEKENNGTLTFNDFGKVLTGDEKVFLSTIGLEGRLAALDKGNLTATVSYININYNGNNNSPVAFELLEGLQNGNNATWSVFYQRTLANNLQIDISYNGRASETFKTIHSGGVQVRAFF